MSDTLGILTRRPRMAKAKAGDMQGDITISFHTYTIYSDYKNSLPFSSFVLKHRTSGRTFTFDGISNTYSISDDTYGFTVIANRPEDFPDNDVVFYRLEVTYEGIPEPDVFNIQFVRNFAHTRPPF